MLHINDDDASWFEPDSPSDSEPEFLVPELRGFTPFVSQYPDSTFKMTVMAKYH
jgi:hypothetical protein